MEKYRQSIAQGIADKPDSRGLAARLADDTWFWSAGAVLFCLVSILKGLRVPSLWAATQANLDYHEGFIKRGLFGQIAHSLGIHIAHYDVFVLLSSLLLLILLVLLFWWVSRSGARQLGNGVVVTVFAASFTITYLAHLMGYLEIPLAALALVALASSALHRRLIGVLLAGVIGVLIHESYVLTFLPMTLLPAFLAALASRRSPLRALASIAAVVAGIAVVVLIVALAAPMTAERANGVQAAMAATVDFPTRDDFFPVLTRSAADNLVIMMKTMTHGLWWLAQFNAFVTFMPTAAFFIWVALGIVDTCHEEAQRLAVKAAVVFTSLCPLSMQFVGWDIYRWYALAAFSSFVSMTVVCNHYDGPAVSTRIRTVRNLGIALIAINMATGTGLFDGYRVDTFPFVDFWKSVTRWIAAGGHFAQPAA
jgi:hypothetical protein